jgi:hypothetical protein
VACAALVAACAGTAAAAKPPPPAAKMKAIVRAWSANLNAGRNAAEARLFALPATMIQGPYVYRLATRQQVARWHAALPCSGTILSIVVRGRYATAVFRLGNRPTSRCDAAPGTLAAARFTIVGGKITVWQQVPPPLQGPPA